MSKLIYTTHAKERMLERAVDKIYVELALKSPTKIEEYNEGYRVFKKFGSKTLVVGVHTHMDDSVSVSTVFWK
jgi:hypothetical protein